MTIGAVAEESTLTDPERAAIARLAVAIQWTRMSSTTPESLHRDFLGLLTTMKESRARVAQLEAACSEIFNARDFEGAPIASAWVRAMLRPLLAKEDC